MLPERAQRGRQQHSHGTARLYAAPGASPLSPILIDSLSLADSGTQVALLRPPGTQSVLEYTAGATFKSMPDDRWTHTVVAGFDGYALDGVPDDRTPIPGAADSALRAARGEATRGTLRLSSSARVSQGARASTDLTLLLEQSLLRQQTAGQSAPQRMGAPEAVYGTNVTQWRSTSGVSALVSTALFNRFFATGGVRFETATGAGAVTIPMVGGAWAISRGAATLKLRAAYGDGVRWPQTTPRQALVEGVRSGTAVTGLTPERQSGVEGGFDLIIGRALTLQATRFDQTASGLIQWVSVQGDSSGGAPGPGGGPGRRIGYEFQNVGEIANSGWEFQGTLARGRLSVIGTLSLVDSRVRQLANGYTGDLAPGDRMLQVPARMMSLTAAWSGSRWAGSMTAYRAEDWVNYDRLALAQAFQAGGNGGDLVGSALRSYWVTYPGVTHLRATASWSFGPRLALIVRGDNLLNQQTGEPDNVTVLPGRTISLAVRAGW
jgi:iron complex outermembrane receptor protein